MNKLDLINYIVSNINFTSFGDYTLDSTQEDGFAYLLFKREDYTNCIYFGVGPQDRRTPNKLVIGNNIHCWISFPKVTSILKYIHSKTNQPDTSNKAFLITVSSYPGLNLSQGPIFNISDDVVIDGETVYSDVLNSKCLALEEYFHKFYLPFFNKISSLQTVDEEIVNRIPHMELSDYIPGQYMTLKKQIIMKLCNNSNYDEYVTWLGKNYESALQLNPDRYLNQYNMFLELTNYLNTDFNSQINLIT